MTLGSISAAVALLASLSGGVWWVATEVAMKDDLVVVASKADYALDKQMEYLLSQINRLDAKARAREASQYDMEQLRYLREELKRLRALRRGS